MSKRDGFLVGLRAAIAGLPAMPTVDGMPWLPHLSGPSAGYAPSLSAPVPASPPTQLPSTESTGLWDAIAALPAVPTVPGMPWLPQMEDPNNPARTMPKRR